MKTAKRTGRRLYAVLLALTLLLGTLPIAAAAAETAPDSTVTLSFTDSGVTASGSDTGYEIDGTSLKITDSGVYTVTGSCSEGNIVVKKGTTDVTLILEDLTLSCSTTAPLACNKETDVTVYLSGTVNLTDNESLDNEESEDFEGAAIKVKSGSSLVVTGTGILNANGVCKNGIKGAALSTVTVNGGTLNITAANNGLAGDNEIIINGGTINIIADNEGIKASPDDDDTDSLGNITINGGSITVTAGDDGIHADGDLIITNGTVTVSAGDDGLKAEYGLTVDGGNITITQCCEGIEGASVVLNGGTGRITASDDGINAANSDLTDYSFVLSIGGGNWYINAGGDGLDSNGTITVSGGVTEVYGAANSGNVALDSMTGCTVSGGTLLAVGMNGMVETPASGVYVLFGSTGMFGGNPFGGTTASTGGVTLSSGDVITIQDSNGTVLHTATAVKTANCVIFASDALSSGETYTLCINGSAAATTSAVTGSGSAMGGQQGQVPGGQQVQVPGGQQGQMPGGQQGQMPGGQQGLVPGQPSDSQSQASGSSSSGSSSSGSSSSGSSSSGSSSSGSSSSGSSSSGGQSQIPVPGSMGFMDVTPDQYYYDAVLWALSKNITAGTSGTTFSPDAACTRAQMVTFLWRSLGCPAVDADNPFFDVDEDDYYYEAVVWAMENDITVGTSGTTFSPNALCTRAQAVAFLWRLAGSAAANGVKNPFDDVQADAYYYDAVLQAVAGGVTTGTSESTFSPDDACTRAQIVTFLYRTNIL